VGISSIVDEAIRWPSVVCAKRRMPAPQLGEGYVGECENLMGGFG
jgi:hypothetical protein